MSMRRYYQLLLLAGTAILGFIAGILTSPSQISPTVPIVGGKAADLEKEKILPQDINEGNPLAPILSMLGEPDYLKQMASLGASLDRLSASQMHELIDLLRNRPAEDRDRLLSAVIAHWSSRDPVAATAWIRRYLDDPMRINGIAVNSRFPNFGGCLKGWAQAAPQYALEVARENPDSETGRGIMQLAISAMGGSYEERFRTLVTFPESRQRKWMASRILSSWAKEDHAAALAAVKGLPQGSDRDESTLEVLRVIARNNPTVALAEPNASNLENAPMFGSVLTTVAFADPALATKWLESRDPAQQADLAKILISGWSDRDPVAALKWGWDRGMQTAGSGTHLLAWEHLRNAFVQKPEATMEWLKQLPAGVAKDQLIETMTNVAPKVASVLPLLSYLEGDAAVAAARKIGGRLVSEDPAHAEQWAMNLPQGPTRTAAWEGIGKVRSEPLPIPAGPDRDAMLSGMALRAAYLNPPQKAVERALEIGSPALRKRAFDDALTLWVERPYPATVQSVQEWIQGAPIPGEWKKKWLEELRTRSAR